MLKLLLILSPLTCWASDHSDLEFLRTRQRGFAAWQAADDAFEARREVGAEKVKRQREKHTQQMEQVRENFKRVPRTNLHLEDSYLAAQARREAKREEAQRKYAEKHREVDEYVEKYVIPMKSKEYDLKSGNVNDSQP